MFHKSCFVYLCYDFPIIGILCISSIVLYVGVLLSLWLVFFVSQALFCIFVFFFPYYWYFMYHKRCFVYLFSAFPIIGILCFTSVVLYICVMISLLLVFYVSQALFCISVWWFPFNMYSMFPKELFCIFVFCFPYYWYLMSHKRCFVYLCYDFPMIGILCFTSVVLYICVYDFHIIDILCFTRLFCISVLWFPYNWYFMSHKRCFVYLCYDFPIIGILYLTNVVLYICVMISP